MQISGIIEKVYDYDFGTGDISMDILSDGKVIRCTGISGRFQAGHPVINNYIKTVIGVGYQFNKTS